MSLSHQLCAGVWFTLLGAIVVRFEVICVRAGGGFVVLSLCRLHFTMLVVRPLESQAERQTVFFRFIFTMAPVRSIAREGRSPNDHSHLALSIDDS